MADLAWGLCIAIVMTGFFWAHDRREQREHEQLMAQCEVVELQNSDSPTED